MKKIFILAGLLWASHGFAQQTYFQLCFSNSSCAPEHFTVDIMDTTFNGIPVHSNLIVFPEPSSDCYYYYGLIWLNHPVNVSINSELPGDITYPDVIRLTKHLTGAEPFTDPYQWIAADIDKNNIVDSTDREELINYIIGVYTEFPNNSFWRFYPDTFVFANPAAPLSQPIPSVFMLQFPADTVMMSAKAVQIGDVDMSGCTVTSTSIPFTSANVKVYPNPVNEVLNVISSLNHDNFRATLYDQLGRCVYNGLSIGNAAGIPVDNYTPGIYFLQVYQNEQIIHNQTIIIQK